MSSDQLAIPGRDRLRVDRGPVRLLFSGVPWRSTAYLLSYLPVALVTACVCLVTCALLISLAVTWLVLPGLVILAAVIRVCADLERIRSRMVGEHLEGEYATPSGGLVARARRRWTSASVWRDLGYLLGLLVPLAAIDLATLAGWIGLLALFTMPAWFWLVPNNFDDGTHAHGVVLGYLPDGPRSTAGFGWWVGSFPRALLVALVALVLILGYQYLLVSVARLHRYAARTMLGPRVDPLEEVREIVAERRWRA